MNKLSQILDVLRKGNRLREPEALKNSTIWLGFLTALVAALDAYGVAVPWVSEQLLGQISELLVAVFGVFTAISTAATSNKVGLPGLPEAEQKPERGMPELAQWEDEFTPPEESHKYSGRAAALQKMLKNPRVRALLRTIRWAEGTSGNDGYFIQFGYVPFTDISDKPRKVIRKGKYRSSAAGAYQIINKTWDALQKKLHLPDFSPESQDIAALQLITEKRALAPLLEGKTQLALSLIGSVWASLPNNSYGQPQRKMQQLLNIYDKYLREEMKK